ncbi:MAG: ATP-dependent RNA helicase DbpA [Myxococcota bacterium]|nr:ATP-dependent RNA helicase DbpA [Myxococcota bacterium]
MSTEFRSLALSPELLEVVAELGYQAMTPVQAAAIPVLLAGQDIVAQSRTGSGKTAAFTLPILQSSSFEQRVPVAIVLCPTRELSAQVAREMRKLGRRIPGLRVLVLAGGEPRRRQTSALAEGAHLIVGTPGRVLDHLKRGDLTLDRVRTIVLDEADRMLDMGFEEDMSAILRAVPRLRQTAFFSATFPSSIEAMSRKYQQSPARVTIETEAAERAEIRHVVTMIEPDQRLEALRWALAAHPHESALVFANFKTTVAEVGAALTKAGLSADCLHGDLEQYERDRVMAKFRNGSTRVLVATDVAARGIDIEGLDLVVNYELPSKPDVYVHRAGRTGRAGETGVAISLASARDRERLAAIEETIGAPLERVKRARSDAPKRATERDAKMDTLRVSGGRKQKIRPADILGALTGEAGGLAGSDIGKIEIHDDFTYVAVARTVSKAAQKGLSEGRIKGKKFQVVLEK